MHRALKAECETSSTAQLLDDVEWKPISQPPAPDFLELVQTIPTAQSKHLLALLHWQTFVDILCTTVILCNYNLYTSAYCETTRLDEKGRGLCYEALLWKNDALLDHLTELTLHSTSVALPATASPRPGQGALKYFNLSENKIQKFEQHSSSILEQHSAIIATMIAHSRQR